MPGSRTAKRILEGREDAERPFLSALPGSDREPGDPSEDPVEVDPAVEAMERARQEGFSEGHRQAVEAFEREVEEFRREMASTLARLADLEASMTREHEALLLETALEASSRIVRSRIDSDDPVAARALSEAIAALPASAGLRVRLHPDDMEPTAREMADEIERGKVELVPDRGVSRGGCVVESAVGTVDATVETATEAARSAALGEGGPS